jgi:hypothetical protein
MIHLMHLLQIFFLITGTTVFGQEHLQIEVNRLKEELEQVRLEEAEITLKERKIDSYLSLSKARNTRIETDLVYSNCSELHHIQ